MKILEGLEQGSEQWKKLRYSKIGCSDLSVIMGINLWKTPYQLWREKIMQIDTPDNEDMKRGREGEAAALKNWNTDIVVDDQEFHYKPIVAISDAHDWLMGSFDGWNGCYPLEIKCPRKHHESIPDYYIPQLQGLMAVSGAEIAYFFSWCNGIGRCIDISKDQAYIDEMLVKAKEFYDRLINFDPPPMGPKDFLDKDEDLGWKTLAEKFIIAKHKRIEAEIEEGLLKRTLIEHAEGHSTKGCGVRVTKVITKGRIDYDAIPELKGLDLEKYRGETKEIWRVT